MTLLLQLAIGSLMIGMTTVLHAIALDFIIKHVHRLEVFFQGATRYIWKPLASAIVVVTIFTSHVLHIWLWAFLYLALGCEPINNFSDSLHFATVTYTTLGYGDITLGQSYRMLSGVEAANGFILFGWTTAFIFEIISRIYKREVRSI
jgi:voltage-gated potassium channel